jgi:hypothetical protein
MKKLHLAILSFLASLSFILLTAPSYPALSQETDLHPVYLPLIARDYDPTWVWGEPELVTISPYPRNILMATDNHGRQHLFWDVSTGERFIYHSYQTVEGWTEPAKVAETLGMSELILQPLVTPDGKIHLLWHNTLVYFSSYRIMYAYFDGQSWSLEEEVAHHSSLIKFGRLNYSDNLDIYLSYGTSEILGNYYHRTRTHSGWSESIDITDPTIVLFLSWKDIWPDRLGGVHFYGVNVLSMGPDLVYSYWSGGEYVYKRQKLSYKPASLFSPVLDRNESLHLHKKDTVPIPGGNIDGLYHQCMDRNMDLLPAKVLSGSENISGYKFTWDSANLLAFAWKGSNDPRFKLVLIDDCTVIAEKQGDFSALGSYSFRYLTALSLNTTAGKFCTLVDLAYQSTYGLLCADVRR